MQQECLRQRGQKHQLEAHIPVLDPSADLSEPLRRAVDDVLAAHTDGEQQARLDRLRVLRSEMLNRERVAKE